ncbi:hypothetical protein BTJ40_00240 [Microbulbifer sp. A4B17]|uniref:hypothetical protein n=1 Tax=Microbulbifer sp. A4B17 TaxID=359370 RepID=UPI000D52B63D|nr:hypothetical protein [Microbulbifer sp. A4B17]AWF79382.1 hypothetical protein BTJ40_00240 [Microbulbifer sp. A4B17]
MKLNSQSILAAKNLKKIKSGNRFVQGLSILASVVLPITAAYVVYYTGLGVPKNTINQGELLQPPFDIAEIKITQQGQQFSLVSEAESKWRYLIISDSDCGKDCEDLLYISRQVHIRLGEKAHRVERLLVVSDSLDEKRQEQIQIQHPKLKIVNLDGENFKQLIEKTDHDSVTSTKALLVDQEGFAMMAYDRQHSGNQLLKDIKRLLKYSYEQ